MSSADSRSYQEVWNCAVDTVQFGGMSIQMQYQTEKHTVLRQCTNCTLTSWLGGCAESHRVPRPHPSTQQRPIGPIDLDSRPIFPGVGISLDNITEQEGRKAHSLSCKCKADGTSPPGCVPRVRPFFSDRVPTSKSTRAVALWIRANLRRP
jgi:hypothetical protein